MKVKECLHKLNRLNTLLEKYGGSLTMSKKDLALWNIWYSRGKRLKEKFIQKYAESYASKQMPSEEKIRIEANSHYPLHNNPNTDERVLYNRMAEQARDAFKVGVKWLKSLQQENQTED